MNIAGVVVHGAPRRAQRLAGQIRQIPGAEVHAMSADGRFVVIIERDREEDLDSALSQMAGLRDVLAAALVYHYCDSNDSVE